jgi:hypothetical protein
VVSLAVLADQNPKWKVSEYQHELWGCRTSFSFPFVKLLDYKDRWEWLESSRNPFAVVVMAHLKTQETRKDKDNRLEYKLALSKRLYHCGWTKDDIIKLYRFIDWIMALPAEMENAYHHNLLKYEKEVNMQYISTAERIGMEKGRLQGRKEGKQEGRLEGKIEGKLEGILDSLQTVLEVKFGVDGLAVYKKVKKIKELDTLKTVLEAIKIAKSPDEVLKVIKTKK